MLDGASAPAIAGLLAALAAPALGQELAPGAAGTPVAAPAPVIVTPAAAPAADWTGFYAGGQLSFGRLD
jgi:hypothetical protein